MSEKSKSLLSRFIGDYSGKNNNGDNPEKSDNPEGAPTQEDCVVDLPMQITDLENTVIPQLNNLDLKVNKLENTIIPQLNSLDLKVSKLIEANKNLITYFSTQRTKIG